jgi:hypothetical protein
LTKFQSAPYCEAFKTQGTNARLIVDSIDPSFPIEDRPRIATIEGGSRMMNVSVEAPRFERRKMKRDEAIPRIRRPRSPSVSGAGFSLLLSAQRWFSDKRDQGTFVGILSPSILVAGLVMLFLFVDHQVTAGSIYLSY